MRFDSLDELLCHSAGILFAHHVPVIDLGVKRRVVWSVATVEERAADYLGDHDRTLRGIGSAIVPRDMVQDV